MSLLLPSNVRVALSRSPLPLVRLPVTDQAEALMGHDDDDSLAPSSLWRWPDRGQQWATSVLDLPSRRLRADGQWYGCLKPYMRDGREPTYTDGACVVAVNVGVLASFLAPTLAAIFDFQWPVGPSFLNPHGLVSVRSALACAAVLPVEVIVAAPIVAGWIFGGIMSPAFVAPVPHRDRILQTAKYSGALGALCAMQILFEALDAQLPHQQPINNYYYILAAAIIGRLNLPLVVIGGSCIMRHLAAEVLSCYGHRQGYEPLRQTMGSAEEIG